jgi:malonyl CoA-acyl carrier protein transacylase
MREPGAVGDRLKLNSMCGVNLAAHALMNAGQSIRHIHGNADEPQVRTAIKDALVRQAASPVRWVETVQTMASLGVESVIECGPGKVLSGLVKRIHGELTTDAINDQASMDALLETIGS